ncbi:MAG: hypothetical protein AB7T63_05020 [Planctomycetota bacterium]
MLERLLAWHAKVGGEEGAPLHLRSVRDDHEGWVLEIEGEDPDDEDAEPIAWEVRADGVIAYRIQTSTSWTMEVHREHPLLMPYLSPPAEVHMGSRPEDPARLLGEVARHLHALAGTWWSLADWVVMDHPWLTGEALDGDPPPLARGPLGFLQGIAPLVQAAGGEPKLLVGAIPPGVSSAPPHVLVLDDSWCVSPRFACRRLDDR